MTGALTTDTDREELDLLLRGFQVSRMLRLIADIGVATKSPQMARSPCKNLSSACNVMPEPMLRVFACACRLGLSQVTAGGCVAHTPRSRLLRTDTPNSMHRRGPLLDWPRFLGCLGHAGRRDGRRHTTRGGLEHGSLRLSAPAPERSPQLRRDDGDLPRQPARRRAAAYDFRARCSSPTSAAVTALRSALSSVGSPSPAALYSTLGTSSTPSVRRN